jgi:hypothetical protein
LVKFVLLFFYGKPKLDFFYWLKCYIGIKWYRKGVMYVIIKSRSESQELGVLRSLNARANLSEQGKYTYLSAEKGYEGEVLFDKLVIPAVDGDMVFLNDLLLEHQGSEFQIDSLGISGRKIYLFEVKYFEGDFLIDQEKWRAPSGKEIKNPRLQMARAESLLRQVTEHIGFRYPVESYLLFINPEFHLDNPPGKTNSIVYPAQLNRFIRRIQNRSLNISKPEIRLAEKLLSLHKEESEHSRIPEYSFEELRKGIICNECGDFNQFLNHSTLTCTACGNREKCQNAILRTIEEFKLLFPELKVKANTIFEFCEIIGSKRTITRVLCKNFKRVGHGKYSYYI